MPARRGRKRKVPLEDENQRPAKKDVLPPISEVPQIVSIYYNLLILLIYVVCKN